MTHPLKKPVLVVCAAQRSGTNVLEETLAQGPTFEKFGEIFLSPDKLKNQKARQLNYFHYRAQRFQARPELSTPTKENQRSLLTSYLNMLCDLTDKDAVIIDIKYTSWHHLNQAWHLPSQPPFLVKLIRELNCPVVHLIRRNSFQRSCSEVVAKHTQRYHVRREAETRESITLKIDPTTLERRINLIDEHVPCFRNFFSVHSKYLELYYEDLFDGDRLSSEVSKQIASLCQFPVNFDPTLTQRKAIPRLKDFIENFEELQSYFSGTEIGRQLEAA